MESRSKYKEDHESVALVSRVWVVVMVDWKRMLHGRHRHSKINSEAVEQAIPEAAGRVCQGFDQGYRGDPGKDRLQGMQRLRWLTLSSQLL